MILVVFALLVGVLLLWKGGGGQVTTDAASAINAGNGAAAKGSTTTAASATASTVTPPASLKVLAVNGSPVKGLAAKTKDQLAAAGYSAVTIGDATQQVTTTIVYFIPGSESDAKAVAAVLGLAPARVTAMPQTPPVKALGESKVVVVLGPDAPTAAPAATTTAAPAATTTTAKK